MCRGVEAVQSNASNLYVPNWEQALKTLMINVHYVINIMSHAYTLTCLHTKILTNIKMKKRKSKNKNYCFKMLIKTIILSQWY